MLRPGGVFALTFSTRWFEPKVIRIWPELHEFERMGLVSQFFVRSDKFNDLHTLSERGWPRLPDDEDRYYPELAESDPVYAVWGRKKVECREGMTCLDGSGHSPLAKVNCPA